MSDTVSTILPKRRQDFTEQPEESWNVRRANKEEPKDPKRTAGIDQEVPVIDYYKKEPQKELFKYLKFINKTPQTVIIDPGGQSESRGQQFLGAPKENVGKYMREVHSDRVISHILEESITTDKLQEDDDYKQRHKEVLGKRPKRRSAIPLSVTWVGYGFNKDKDYREQLAEWLTLSIKHNKSFFELLNQRLGWEITNIEDVVKTIVKNLNANTLTKQDREFIRMLNHGLIGQDGESTILKAFWDKRYHADALINKDDILHDEKLESSRRFLSDEEKRSIVAERHAAFQKTLENFPVLGHTEYLLRDHGYSDKAMHIFKHLINVASLGIKKPMDWRHIFNLKDVVDILRTRHPRTGSSIPGLVAIEDASRWDPKSLGFRFRKTKSFFELTKGFKRIFNSIYRATVMKTQDTDYLRRQSVKIRRKMSKSKEEIAKWKAVANELIPSGYVENWLNELMDDLTTLPPADERGGKDAPVSLGDIMSEYIKSHVVNFVERHMEDKVDKVRKERERLGKELQTSNLRLEKLMIDRDNKIATIKEADAKFRDSLRGARLDDAPTTLLRNQDEVSRYNLAYDTGGGYKAVVARRELEVLQASLKAEVENYDRIQRDFNNTVGQRVREELRNELINLPDSGDFMDVTLKGLKPLEVLFETMKVKLKRDDFDLAYNSALAELTKRIGQEWERSKLPGTPGADVIYKHLNSTLQQQVGSMVEAEIHERAKSATEHITKMFSAQPPEWHPTIGPDGGIKFPLGNIPPIHPKLFAPGRQNLDTGWRPPTPYEQHGINTRFGARQGSTLPDPEVPPAQSPTGPRYPSQASTVMEEKIISQLFEDMLS